MLELALLWSSYTYAKENSSQVKYSPSSRVPLVHFKHLAALYQPQMVLKFLHLWSTRPELFNLIQQSSMILLWLIGNMQSTRLEPQWAPKGRQSSARPCKLRTFRKARLKFPLSLSTRSKWTDVIIVPCLGKNVQSIKPVIELTTLDRLSKTKSSKRSHLSLILLKMILWWSIPTSQRSLGLPYAISMILTTCLHQPEAWKPHNKNDKLSM